jgi:hypothetical protein
VPRPNFKSLSRQRLAALPRSFAAALLLALLATALPADGAKADFLDDVFGFFGGGSRSQGGNAADAPKAHRSSDKMRRHPVGKAYPVRVSLVSSYGRCMKACDGAASPRSGPAEASPKGVEKLCPCQMTVGTDALVRAEDFLTDPTLRSGDVVVTTEGVRIYRGQGREFWSLAQIRDISKDKRSALAAIDRLLEKSPQAEPH